MLVDEHRHFEMKRIVTHFLASMTSMENLKMQRNLSDHGLHALHALHGHSSNSRQLEPSNRSFAVHRVDVGHGIIRQEIIYCARKQVS